MTEHEAIEILELHNKWRRDDNNKYKMAEPKELGMAIDTVVSKFKKLALNSVSKNEILIGFLTWYENEGRERYAECSNNSVINAYINLKNNQCSCIDKCASKRTRYICKAKRNCKHKKIKDLKEFIKQKTDQGTANYLGKEIREICGMVETEQCNMYF